MDSIRWMPPPPSPEISNVEVEPFFYLSNVEGGDCVACNNTGNASDGRKEGERVKEIQYPPWEGRRGRTGNKPKSSKEENRAAERERKTHIVRSIWETHVQYKRGM